MHQSQLSGCTVTASDQSTYFVDETRSRHQSARGRFASLLLTNSANARSHDDDETAIIPSAHSMSRRGQAGGDERGLFCFCFLALLALFGAGGRVKGGSMGGTRGRERKRESEKKVVRCCDGCRTMEVVDSILDRRTHGHDTG